MKGIPEMCTKLDIHVFILELIYMFQQSG